VKIDTRKMIAILLITYLVSVLSSVTDCDTSSLFKIRNLTLSPEKPIGGQNSTLYSTYEVFTQVDAGTATYSCTLNGIPVFNNNYDLCTQTPCPITVGVHNDISETQTPAVSGSLLCKIKWKDTSNNPLLCIQTKLDQPLNSFIKWF